MENENKELKEDLNLSAVNKQTATKKKNWLIRLWNYYTTYEICWYFGVILFMVVSIIFFFDTVVGKGSTPGFETAYAIFSIIYLLSTITCELLIAKQSRWNFIVSLTLVQTTMFAVYFLDHLYGLAVVALVYWGIVSTISFVNWTKHKDNLDAYLTQVRKLTWKQDIILLIGIVIFTFGVGALLNLIPGELNGYLDACTQAFGLINGLLILYRYREQWIVWILYNILEAIIWISTGNYILIIQNIALIINSTYGIIQWTKYAKKHPESTKFSFIDHANKNADDKK